MDIDLALSEQLQYYHHTQREAFKAYDQHQDGKLSVEELVNARIAYCDTPEYRKLSEGSIPRYGEIEFKATFQDLYFYQINPFNDTNVEALYLFDIQRYSLKFIQVVLNFIFAHPEIRTLLIYSDQRRELITNLIPDLMRNLGLIFSGFREQNIVELQVRLKNCPDITVVLPASDLNSFRSIKQLCLTNIRFDIDSMTVLLPPTLQHLELKQIRLDDLRPLLCNALSTHRSIETLCILNCMVLDSNLSNIICSLCLSSIQYLKLKADSLSGATFDSLAELLSKSFLNNLTLDISDLTCNGMFKLVAPLKLNQKFETLILSQCHISETNIASLGQILRTNKSLKSLTIDFDRATQHFTSFEEITSALMKNSTLLHLDIIPVEYQFLKDLLVVLHSNVTLLGYDNYPSDIVVFNRDIVEKRGAIARDILIVARILILIDLPFELKVQILRVTACGLFDVDMDVFATVLLDRSTVGVLDMSSKFEAVSFTRGLNYLARTLISG